MSTLILIWKIMQSALPIPYYKTDQSLNANCKALGKLPLQHNIPI